MSSYYNLPTHITVISNSLQPKNNLDLSNTDGCHDVYKREVDLVLGAGGKEGVRYCRAVSEVTLKTDRARDVYTSVGLAQLYQRLEGGVHMEVEGWGWGEGGGGFWREYRLEGEEVECRIREEFEEDLWELKVDGVDGGWEI
ncbi:hypothetical protein TrCOL_g3844 [Triparma columacea]|uniref:Uncharacterized protein n=1 Tax=Triparma columacea TaxID=722753 RepID=A0A9W7LB19_9STRA|nr:hypothetical protein TrCOL_g3844 [Triparma columacea]